MADHIPFITSEESCRLVSKRYADSAAVRISLDQAPKCRSKVPAEAAVWIDPTCDGLDDLETRSHKPERHNPWFDFMGQFPGFETIGDPASHAKPSKATVAGFVTSVMDACAEHIPNWITVPQLPTTDDGSRNKINRALAAAAGEWKAKNGFAGTLILPMILMKQKHSLLKVERNPKVKSAADCYKASDAGGLWVVDKSLDDESGSPTLRTKRFPALISLHRELNDKIGRDGLKIAGPYWGLNLVLWARGLVDHPAIGVGSGYRFFMSGGHARIGKKRIVLPGLRRRAVVGQALKDWIDAVVEALPENDPNHTNYVRLQQIFPALNDEKVAREQVAVSYKNWLNKVAPSGQSRTRPLYRDLSAAFELGCDLPSLSGESVKSPEAVAETLMPFARPLQRSI